MNGENANGHRLRKLDSIVPNTRVVDETVQRLVAVFAALPPSDQIAIRRAARHKRREDARRDPDAAKPMFDIARMSRLSDVELCASALESADGARRWAFAHDDSVCEICG